MTRLRCTITTVFLPRDLSAAACADAEKWIKHNSDLQEDPRCAGFSSVFTRGWHNPGSYQFMEEELPVMPEEIHFTELSLTGVRIMEKSVDKEPCLRM